MAHCQAMPMMPARPNSPEKPRWEPTTSLRGETTTRRFELPKTNIAFSANGFATYGIDEKQTRRIISHEFEQHKKWENNASLDRQSEKPQGQRFAASTEWLQQHQQQCKQKQAEEEKKQAQLERDSLAGMMHQLPEYDTSTANPLMTRPKAAPAAARDGSSSNSSSSSSSSSDGGDGGATLPQSHELCVQAQHAHDLHSHLVTGSLEPVSAQAEEEKERLKKAQALLAAAFAAECKKQQQLEHLEQQLMLEYPHGVPKRLQKELIQLGVQLPSLGFGYAHSVPSREAAYTSTR